MTLHIRDRLDRAAHTAETVVTVGLVILIIAKCMVSRRIFVVDIPDQAAPTGRSS